MSIKEKDQKKKGKPIKCWKCSNSFEWDNPDRKFMEDDSIQSGIDRCCYACMCKMIGINKMNNDQEWTDEKQEHLNDILYKCFLDGYCSSADVPVHWEDEKHMYTDEDYVFFIDGVIKNGKKAAHDYVKFREGKE